MTEPNLMGPLVQYLDSRKRLLATLPHEADCDMGQHLGERDVVDLKCFCLTAVVTNTILDRLTRDEIRNQLARKPAS